MKPWIDGWTPKCTCNSCEECLMIAPGNMDNAKIMVTSMFLAGCMIIGGCLNGHKAPKDQFKPAIVSEGVNV